jgi:hypothetical protein
MSIAPRRAELFRMHNPNRACPIGRGILMRWASSSPSGTGVRAQPGSATVEDVAKKVWPGFFAEK